MGARQRARSIALQMLFQSETSAAAPYWKERFLELHPAAPDAAEFALRLVDGVLGQRERLDAAIQRHTEHWTLDRMARVDRNVLRLAAFELFACPDIPIKVTLNESIELARRFGDEQSGAFVNGILDHMIHHEPELRERREQNPLDRAPAAD
jgi:N utilization substance protein B